MCKFVAIISWMHCNTCSWMMIGLRMVLIYLASGISYFVMLLVYFYIFPNLLINNLLMY